jgi:hypothetical protein
MKEIGPVVQPLRSEMLENESRDEIPAGSSVERPLTMITPFIHQKQFTLVTGARFESGPTGNVRDGRFCFVNCWTGSQWTVLVSLALLFKTRTEALGYLDQHRGAMEALIKSPEPCAEWGR